MITDHRRQALDGDSALFALAAGRGRNSVVNGKAASETLQCPRCLEPAAHRPKTFPEDVHSNLKMPLEQPEIPEFSLPLFLGCRPAGCKVGDWYRSLATKLGEPLAAEAPKKLRRRHLHPAPDPAAQPEFFRPNVAAQVTSANVWELASETTEGNEETSKGAKTAPKGIVAPCKTESLPQVLPRR